MSAPLARASPTSFATLATEAAQRGRRCALQVWLVKSITRSAVSLGSMVTGLSGGGAGSLAAAHSSTMVWAGAGSAHAHTMIKASSATIAGRMPCMGPSLGFVMDYSTRSRLEPANSSLHVPAEATAEPEREPGPSAKSHARSAS